MDDDDLIARVAAGDHAALRSVFDHHAPWVAARLRRALPAWAVEDVLQETFLAVWRGAGRYRPDGRGGAWIWGIARRQAALWVRAQVRQAAGAPLWPLVPARDPGDVVIGADELERAFAALGTAEPTAGLDPEQRVSFRALLRDIGRRATVVVSTHLVEDVGAACAEVGLMRDGQLVFRGTAGELAVRGEAHGIGDTPLERGYSAVLAGKVR